MIDVDTKELMIPRELHGERIDVVLARMLPDYSRSQLSQWLKQGKITVDSRTLKPKDKVNHGSLIQLNLDQLTENKTGIAEAEDIPLDIVYEDDYLLVINKPAGLVVHPGAGNWEHTLVNALLHHLPQLSALPRAGLIHRLDKDTTGLLVIAKTLTVHTQLTRQMQEREIHRHYLTLVQGHLISGGEIATCFGRHPSNRLKMAVCAQGREAVTHYSIKKQYQYFTLLEVQLLTGRTHQIRVHMAHIKHPVFGDQLYGGRTRVPAEADESLIKLLQQFKRQALHAYTLSFEHPHSDEMVSFSAPLPEDFATLLSALDQYKENK
ncbi:23S rRNA pseudouridine(1911/1915/1917) synthase RluD [Legionella genomosp. 1]|uniref:23S rRNA pseudouridine(1911/1915/1917) synthase RluD n=1 Tax=Legionella genomosp. 1 TaxID=1093625 RepID=UPI00105578C0|nr:23S rRNA pseudouridine(1911/1915/1917) synthase RluD [Legionella genomosp. 1]